MHVLRSKRYVAALVVGTLLAGLLTGLPTDVLPNPWFSRMTPVRTLDVVLWPLLSLALGALVATYALPASCRAGYGLSRGAGGGLMGAFAIGCPVCNKLVVAALGFSGALTYFAPLQPILGAAALALTLFVLRTRLRALSTSFGPAPYMAAPDARI